MILLEESHFWHHVKLFVRRTDEELELILFNQNNLKAAKDKTERMAIEIRCHGKTMT